MQHEFDFNDLPYHVKENIFKCLPFKEVSIVSRVDLTWLSIGNKVIRNCFLNLCTSASEELINLKRELTMLPRTVASLQHRLIILRSYYLLEILFCELNIIKVIWRGILFNKEGNTCSLGFLLDEFYSTFNLCKRRNLPAWREDNAIESKLLRHTKIFFDNKLKDIDLNNYFGCIIVDFMDLMIDREYTLDVCYSFQRNICTINGFYKLEHPRYLNRPPQLQNTGSDRPTLSDKKRILQFIVNLVRINNRVTLREEQYNKELEYSSRFGSPDHSFANIEEMLIMNDVRNHPVTLSETNHELKRTEALYDIMAAFQSEEFNTSNSEKGFSCYFHIICPMNNAPLYIINSWNKIKQKIKKNSFIDDINESQTLKDLIYSDDLRSSFSEEEDIPAVNESSDLYVFGCTIKSSLMRQHNITETTALIITEP